ncbi:hypothetical protein NDN08_006562 [Rhodosorus marinus]|uniref:BAP29/BAP31 transmembrane domain-containing protein n=1 Tax=Rhodosorus marinus TaxID=101924 RepID=A0AAV8UJF5_9RHOD|nr:hypothetical protein NDN08_006562 [Rhodosorus marinus]
MLPLPHTVWRSISKVLRTSAVDSALTFIVRFLVVGLAIGVFDSVQSIQGLQEQISVTDPNDLYSAMSLSSRKQRIFRAERNLYLAGFCFALIFIIRRLFQLAAKNADLVDEIKIASQGTRPTTANQQPSSVPATSGTESAPTNTTDQELTEVTPIENETEASSGHEDGVPRQRRGFTQGSDS